MCIRLQTENERSCTIEKQASKRGLFHRLQGRVKSVKQENVPPLANAVVSLLEYLFIFVGAFNV